MAPGCAGDAVTVTAKDLAEPEPHELFAATDIFPLEPAVAVMDVVVELPLHPAGKVHV
jgi:hypothetical protein